MPDNTAIASSGGPSRTITTTRESEGTSSAAATAVTLRLRGEPRQRRAIRWAEDVIDNEGMGKKSSKVCCIYHGPSDGHDLSSDESSSSSSSSSSDSESERPNNRASNAANRRKDKSKQTHKHHQGHDHGQQDSAEHPDQRNERHGASSTQRRPPSPNAYERIPKIKTKRGGGSQTMTEHAR